MFGRHGEGGEDALAVGVCIDPTLVAMNKCFVDCECSGDYTSGHTFVAVTRMFRKEPSCYMAEAFEQARFKS